MMASTCETRNRTWCLNRDRIPRIHHTLYGKFDDDTGIAEQCRIDWCYNCEPTDTAYIARYCLHSYIHRECHASMSI